SPERREPLAVGARGACERLRHELRPDAGGEANVRGVDAPREALAPALQVVHAAGELELPEAGRARRERAAPAVVAEELHVELRPVALAGAAVAQRAERLLVPVREAVGRDLDGLAHDALRGEAAGIHARPHVLDHRFGREVPALCAPRVVHPASGAKSTMASGGSVTESDCSNPCQGEASASTRPRLPTPLPP